MSVAEVMNEIEKLPREEQEKVFVYLAQKQGLLSNTPEVNYLDDASFEKAKNLVPNENAELLRRLAK